MLSIEKIDITIIIETNLALPNNDIVTNNIECISPRKPKTKADMILDFKINHVAVFREQIQLMTTKSGKHTIPISLYKNVFNNLTSGSNKNILLIATESSLSKIDIARKLHQQFSQAQHAYKSQQYLLISIYKQHLFSAQPK